MADKKIIAVVGATGAQGGGLVRAILKDASGEFAARALTRNVNSGKAKALAEAGAEVVAVDIDDAASVRKAFEGAYGKANYDWAHVAGGKPQAVLDPMPIGAATVRLRRDVRRGTPREADCRQCSIPCRSEPQP